MVTLTVISRAGIERDITAGPGLSLMEAIRNAGIDEMLALCGGCLSCATCHVNIDVLRADALPSRSEDELELLEGSEFFAANSRLSCQVPVSEALEGARVALAPEG
ncbi:2Fe-2S iron-sulfur cluster-binding protein [Sphingorhabdus sp.]|uniref:2Fe-2S iron-sulfur cluster-binding protein n=1 Tax=Sphingorhabdus sp. TaxID=1902408 RepID=UPI0037C5C51A